MKLFENNGKKHLLDCDVDELEAIWFLSARSVLIPCHNVRVINEYVAPCNSTGSTNKKTSKNML